MTVYYLDDTRCIGKGLVVLDIQDERGDGQLLLQHSWLDDRPDVTYICLQAVDIVLRGEYFHLVDSDSDGDSDDDSDSDDDDPLFGGVSFVPVFV